MRAKLTAAFDLWILEYRDYEFIDMRQDIADMISLRFRLEFRDSIFYLLYSGFFSDLFFFLEQTRRKIKRIQKDFNYFWRTYRQIV